MGRVLRVSSRAETARVVPSLWQNEVCQAAVLLSPADTAVEQPIAPCSDSVVTSTRPCRRHGPCRSRGKARQADKAGRKVAVTARQAQRGPRPTPLSPRTGRRAHPILRYQEPANQPAHVNVETCLGSEGSAVRRSCGSCSRSGAGRPGGDRCGRAARRRTPGCRDDRSGRRLLALRSHRQATPSDP